MRIRRRRRPPSGLHSRNRRRRRRRRKNGGRVVTRFPPEPNGYLHIGHAKAICLDFGVASEFGGYCNLRFDDTNPVKEDVEYVDSIKDDVQWLGFDWHEREYYASDYYEQLYQFAEDLIRKGVAYVDSLSADEIREHRGTLTEPGKDSPYRIARRRREPRSVPPHARRRVSRRRPRAAREDRHARRPTSRCAIRCCTASAMPSITAPAARGASTRCTTSRIRCRTRSRASPTRSARSSTSTIVRSTTGCIEHGRAP